jgi:hypothetical protein
MPCCFLSPLDMRASRKHHCAIVAYDVQIFWPDTHQPLPSRRAAVCSDAKSEPAFGSLKPWHQIASPRAIGGRCVRRCSSVPCRMMAGPTQLTPMYCAPRGSWCAHISSRTAVCSHGEAPRPPNSSGHAMHSSTRSARSRQNVCATTPATVSSARRSHATAVASSSWANVARRSVRRATSATLAPARARATPAPSPDDAPVTIATRPARSNIGLSFHLDARRPTAVIAEACSPERVRSAP